jgi:hypothetical protein
MNTDERELDIVVDVLLPPTEIDGMGKPTCSSKQAIN